jgi:hypothetical protein
MTGQFVFQYCFCYDGVRGNMACKVRASDTMPATVPLPVVGWHTAPLDVEE